jgi:hypothetical protein
VQRVAGAGSWGASSGRGRRLASGINNAISRVAQLIGIALAAGVASFATGYEMTLMGAAVVTGAAAALVAATVPPS